MAQGGWSWGTTGAPAPIKEYGWDGSDLGAGDTSDYWKVAGHATNYARYDSADGDLIMQLDDEFVSGVMDKGTGDLVFLQIEISSSGSELISIKWRGHATTSFNQHDASPAWEDYPAGGANKTWRYIQVKAKCIEKIEISGEGITIDGEPVGM